VAPGRGPYVMNASDYDSEDLAEVTKTMGKWKMGGEANSWAAKNDDDVEGHSFLKNDAAAAAAANEDVEGHTMGARNAEDDVEGHGLGARNVDDQGIETDESSDKPGVRVRVRVRNDDSDVEGHGLGARNTEDDVEGHTTSARNADDDDVEGHTLGAR
jgi:hypothetical protein